MKERYMLTTQQLYLMSSLNDVCVLTAQLTYDKAIERLQDLTEQKAQNLDNSLKEVLMFLQATEVDEDE